MFRLTKKVSRCCKYCECFRDKRSREFGFLQEGLHNWVACRRVGVSWVRMYMSLSNRERERERERESERERERERKGDRQREREREIGTDHASWLCFRRRHQGQLLMFTSYRLWRDKQEASGEHLGIRNDNNKTNEHGNGNCNNLGCSPRKLTVLRRDYSTPYYNPLLRAVSIRGTSRIAIIMVSEDCHCNGDGVCGGGGDGDNNCDSHIHGASHNKG